MGRVCREGLRERSSIESPGQGSTKQRAAGKIQCPCECRGGSLRGTTPRRKPLTPITIHVTLNPFPTSVLFTAYFPVPQDLGMCCALPAPAPHTSVKERASGGREPACQGRGGAGGAVLPPGILEGWNMRKKLMINESSELVNDDVYVTPPTPPV